MHKDEGVPESWDLGAPSSLTLPKAKPTLI